MAARPAPELRVRPGARYRCFGDGLCCTDIHAVGPIGRTEVRRLTLLAPGSMVRNEALHGMVVAPRNGACGNLGADGCTLHAEHGSMAKPSVCRRFPYRLVVTPAGRRISTEHRCPCRTMGDRPALDREDILASLRDQAGRMTADVTVGERVLISPGRRVLFSRYERVEAGLLGRLAAGEDPLEVLAATPFPALGDVSWTDVAHHYRGKLDGSACGDALAWFGDIVLGLESDEGTRKLRQRPWSASFDRAEARTPEPESPEVILADWIADELWGLEWTEHGSLAHARADLATRLVVARTIRERLQAIGVRPDRAAAEAVLVAEMAGAAPLWRSIVRAFVL